MPSAVVQKVITPSPRTARAAGFTLIEILVVLVIVAILASFSYTYYQNYIDKARVAVAINTFNTVKRVLEDYHTSNSHYPPAIDFNTGADDQGTIVLTSELLAEINKNFHSLDSYTVTPDKYILTAHAADTKRSILILTPDLVVTQGP